jgi:hypothetical protein
MIITRLLTSSIESRSTVSVVMSWKMQSKSHTNTYNAGIQADHARRTLIRQALRTWRLKENVFSPEIARTTFLGARVIMRAGDSREAAELFKKARNLRNTIVGAQKKGDSSLREKDFDELVTFFSR